MLDHSTLQFATDDATPYYKYILDALPLEYKIIVGLVFKNVDNGGKVKDYYKVYIHANSKILSIGLDYKELEEAVQTGNPTPGNNLTNIVLIAFSMDTMDTSVIPTSYTVRDQEGKLEFFNVKIISLVK